MKKLYLSSLRGHFGDWTYYPCLMKLKDIAEKVHFADQIYESKTLRTCFKKKHTPQELMFTFNHWSSAY